MGKREWVWGETVPFSRAFCPFLPVSLPLLSFAPARQAIGYVGMCRTTGYGFCPLALKQRIKITLLSLLSLLSLPKNRWHYWGSFSARLLFFLRVSSSRFTIDVRSRVANSNRNRPRASKTQRHTPIVNFNEYPPPFPPTPHCCAGWSSKSVHDLELNREGERK